MSSLKAKIDRVAKAVGGGGQWCRCGGGGSDGGEDQGGDDGEGADATVYLRALCARCGGFYRLVIEEVVVESREEVDAVRADGFDGAGLVRRPDGRLEFPRESAGG